MTGDSVGEHGVPELTIRRYILRFMLSSHGAQVAEGLEQPSGWLQTGSEAGARSNGLIAGLDHLSPQAWAVLILYHLPSSNDQDSGR